MEEITSCLKLLDSIDFPVSQSVLNSAVSLEFQDDTEFSKWIAAKAEHDQISGATLKLKTLYEKQCAEHEEIIWYLDQEIKQKGEDAAHLDIIEAEVMQKNDDLCRKFQMEWENKQGMFLEEIADLEKAYANLLEKHVNYAALTEEMVFLLTIIIKNE